MFNNKIYIGINVIILKFNFFFRLLEAGEATGDRELPVRAKPGGADHVHLLCPSADARLRAAGGGERDDRAAAGVAQPAPGPAADQDLVGGPPQLEQWHLRQGTHPGILHRVQAERYLIQFPFPIIDRYLDGKPVSKFCDRQPDTRFTLVSL